MIWIILGVLTIVIYAAYRFLKIAVDYLNGEELKEMERLARMQEEAEE